jgi:Zn-dependent peptidase ImmA (M78 family)
MVRALLEAEDEATLLHFVGSMAVRDGVDAVLASMVTTLGLNLTQFRHGIAGDRRAKKGFAYLRERAEHAGIFVLLIGNLGSYHSNLDVDMFRGFALSDPIAPFIVINDQDADTAWSFTLLHELAHIWLGQTGVSGADAASAIEQFCNDIAGHFLLPAHEIAGEEQLRNAPFESLVARINEIAEERQVSRSMVAYKLHRQGVVGRDIWSQLGEFFRQHWIHNRQVERSGDQDRRGPNYFVVRRHRVGPRLISLTRRMLADGSLAPSQAATVLGVKLANVFALIAEDGSWPPGRAAQE